MNNYQNNAFRPKPQAPDLTRAPQHVREAALVTVPFREGEVSGRVVTSKHLANVPNARVHMQRIVDIAEGRTFYAIQMLDYRGLEPLAQVELSDEAFDTLAKNVIALYDARRAALDATLNQPTNPTDSTDP